MSTDRLVIRGGDVVLPGRGLSRCDIGVEQGRIAAILAPGAAWPEAQTLDASHLVVMPGAIDPHLHLGHGKDISRPRVAADADGETAAAVRGGVTCVIPYLMSTEPFEANFADVLAVTAAGARADFGYHFIISTEAQLAGVADYVRRDGVPTFKIFMNNRGGEGARLGLPDINDGFLFRLCEAAAAQNATVCPHPETIEIAWVLRDRLKKSDPEGQGGLALWNASRPGFVEADAVQRAAYIARVAGSRLYVVHTSSAEALQAALVQRGQGAAVAIETCPHYLTHDETWSGGVIGKINPPLRRAADREALWNGILNGDIDTIGTDHVHRDLSSKAGSIWEASPGCPGLDTLLPILISEGHNKRGVPLERIAALTATNVATHMGLSHVKGCIAVGLDADFAIVDPKKVWTVTRDSVASSAGYSIYEGWQLNGQVIHTLVRGAFAMRDQALVPTAVGTGRYCRRRFDAETRSGSSQGR
jgi:dihydropyrimidinase